MIPKIIHYCWFSGDKKPALIKKCIRSWKKYLPDYEIRCWDGNSFNFDSLAFTREAMSVKQYAAASDYVRLFALYHYGGIYLDSDVEIFKSLNEFLDNDFFSGFETFYADSKSEPNHNIEAGILGSIKGFPYLKECMGYYETAHFLHDDGSYDNNTMICPGVLTSAALKYGLQRRSSEEQILSNGIHLYPETIITNKGYLSELFGIKNSQIFDSLAALHHNMGGWTPIIKSKGKLFQFCYHHNMMGLYKFIENCRIKLKNKQ